MDYLPFEYLATVCKTCKHFANKIGIIFYQNYRSVINGFSEDEAKYFPEFIRNIEIASLVVEFNHFFQKKSNFHRLEQLWFSHFEIKKENIEKIKTTLSKVTQLCLISCKMN